MPDITETKMADFENIKLKRKKQRMHNKCLWMDNFLKDINLTLWSFLSKKLRSFGFRIKHLCCVNKFINVLS
jgi:hypothetical protein